MSWIIRGMKWVMLLSGALTLTMIYAAFDPQASLRSTFGESLEGPVAEIVVRNWGVLIALVGAMLIYGAFYPASRPLVLAVAGISKLAFITLVFVHGTQYLGQQAGVAIGVDAVMVLLFATYLVAARRAPASA